MSTDFENAMKKYDGTPLTGIPYFKDNELVINLDFTDFGKDYLGETEEYENADNLEVITGCSWINGMFEDGAFFVVDTDKPENPVFFFAESKPRPFADSFDEFLSKLDDKQKEFDEKKEIVLEKFLEIYNEEKETSFNKEEFLKSKLTDDDVDPDYEENIIDMVCDALEIEEADFELDEFDEDEIPVWEALKVIVNQYELD